MWKEGYVDKHVKEKSKQKQKQKKNYSFLDNGIMHGRTGLRTHEFSLYA